MYRIITAFSKGRSRLAEWIEDHTNPVIKAIAQLYLFPNTQYTNHWRTEVYNNFHEMKVLSNTKKLPTAKFIYDNSWRIDKQFSERHLKWAIRHENTLRPIKNWTVEQFDNLCEQYFRWLSNELSSYIEVDNQAVHGKLLELGL